MSIEVKCYDNGNHTCLAASLDPTTTTQPVALYSNGIEPPTRLGQDVLEHKPKKGK